jgi:hypothetical protein
MPYGIGSSPAVARPDELLNPALESDGEASVRGHPVAERLIADAQGADS